MDNLVELHDNGTISDKDLQLLMDYIDDKLAQGVPSKILAARMRSEGQRMFCLKT